MTTIAPVNGSGVPQAAASLPAGAMRCTIPQASAGQVAGYQPAHKARRLAALHARQAARKAASEQPGIAR